jgi:sulfur relay protein TusB/DsrH
MQDAVFAVGAEHSKASWIREASTKGVKLYATKADLKARSVDEISSVESIGYDDLVELLSKYDGTYS